MALINCHECKREISDSAISCPGCGSPISLAQPKKGNMTPFAAQEVAVMLSKKKNTSHILHLLLSIITGGIWVVVWIIVALSNSMENSKIDSQIKRGKKLSNR